jgi:hypothetical protein
LIEAGAKPQEVNGKAALNKWDSKREKGAELLLKESCSNQAEVFVPKRALHKDLLE